MVILLLDEPGTFLEARVEGFTIDENGARDGTRGLPLRKRGEELYRMVSNYGRMNKIKQQTVVLPAPDAPINAYTKNSIGKKNNIKSIKFTYRHLARFNKPINTI